jgi:hypothetical protein
MNTSDRDDDERNMETQAFASPLNQEDENERSLTIGKDQENEQGRGSAEVDEDEEDKEKTELITKEAMGRVTSGQI